MRKKNKYFGIVPARAGSKGIPNKNLQDINGMPMLQYTLEAAFLSKNLTYSILSSDDSVAIELAKHLKFNVPFERPISLGQDNSSLSDVILHALEWHNRTFNHNPENIVLLQPTSPFRNNIDIDNAIQAFEESDRMSLVSACEVSQHPAECFTFDENHNLKFPFSKENICPEGRQNYNRTLFLDGSMYISNTDLFIDEKRMFSNNSEVYLIDKSHAIDIDDYFMLDLARAISFYSNNNNTDLIKE